MGHIVKTNQYDVVVTNMGDEYTLTFQRKVTPGNGTLLTSYPREDWANAAADKFPRIYEIAQHCGYALLGNEFVKDEHRVHVDLALDAVRSESDFRSMLK